MGGYEWQESPVYNEYIDGETKYGESYGLIRRSLIGCAWSADSLCGSRCVTCHDFSSNVYGNFSTRGRNKR